MTQNPSDLDEDILSQLQNRIQHALHAYTPADQKKLKSAAAGFRPNPRLDTLSELSALKTGEALVSFLDEDGAPMPVEKVTVLPPHSSFQALTPSQIQLVESRDPMYDHYAKAFGAYSAYEALEEQKRQKEADQKKQILVLLPPPVRNPIARIPVALTKTSMKITKTTVLPAARPGADRIVPLLRAIHLLLWKSR
ncbi:DUF853 domain-containing protein [Allobaculum sp. Allo2]|nr:DUF853 domain-containing protein [Allobaculum sp. Allo2]